MDNRRIHCFSIGVAFATFLLIVAGGLVTSTGSGLSVPDWPLSYGKVFPPMVGGIRFEHTHRMIAGVVALLTLVLMVLLLKKEERKWLRWFGVSAFAAVLLQALLGGITVLYFLPLAVSVTHACLAQSFFSWVSAISLFTSKEWRQARLLESNRAFFFQRLSVSTACFIFIQLILGALIRHGQRQEFMVIAHVLTASSIFFQVLVLLFACSREEAVKERFFSNTLILASLVFLQIALGIGALVGKGQVLLVTAHQATGALTLCAAMLLMLRYFRHLKKPVPHRSKAGYFFQLTKPRLMLMALATTALGFVMATEGKVPLLRLTHTLLGCALVGGGANALNQFMERDVDAKMKRTEGRPLPSGKLDAKSALVFGMAISLVGVAHLFFLTNTLTAALAVFTLAIYVLVYTPLKRKTALNTFIGAVAGALPVVMGWTAAGRPLGERAAVLFLILFLWQLPHFLAISWVYREDYLKSGLRMVCLLDERGVWIGAQMVLYCLFLWGASLLPSLIGLSGNVYFSVIFFSNSLLLWLAVCLFVRKLLQAKRFVPASIIYLLTVICVMIADKV